ncbi:electron transfer flavoprotein subunit beta/FixA family protein [Cereibacter sphaeroides]|uniref:electron transfer flavoprotein subunit beta/FixA family protein n=1 Tax=Rhodobacterales TaxID=204455 RepID=UPI0018E0971C|nr:MULTISPECIES: electron transfer flavoprotein subunit beta/FixA family protein [Paracoccaceae]MCE6950088.1 electron transfer flavoprotein subunit beta/FixA family protein [Cereibacter sphaeroides]MCE6958196.1 electron transfer flavoprotein subunit beta/FixA family protein [Cereibacter sphaeroides]MCE6967675.1 electron transfer flavoprotein subunit beta/FixA family protein [Cereibacter sphaeroides]MCE6972486.1 electron transfer flavoprotein subunit beta/FixA family protein [Cereibacter sphaero
MDEPIIEGLDPPPPPFKGLNIVVCIKQVPDSAQIRVHPVTNTIMRQGVPTIVNPYDLFALEEALRLRDEYGGKVTVLCMGPPMAEDALRRCLGIGADKAVLITDRRFAGSDTLATSFALSTALTKIAEERPIDIVFTGKQTIDGDTAQVGPGIARRMELNQLTYVSAIDSLDLVARSIVVRRRSEGGVQVLRSKLPALITMLEDSNVPRRGSIQDLLRAARAPVTVWSAEDAGVTDVMKCGLRGSPTVVKRVFAPSAREEPAEMVTVEGKDPAAMADAILDLIFARDSKLEADMASAHATA